MIRRVIIYTGHALKPESAPYHYNVNKRERMFTLLNRYRADRPPWSVELVTGEDLIFKMGSLHPKETLFVMPAGESSKFDRSFTEEQLVFLQNFFQRGAMGYFTCGAAYWASKKRVYGEICESQDTKGTLEKVSRIPLFEGVAKGPLCPFPAKQFKAGFYSDAVRITDGRTTCAIFLSGGGGFFLDSNSRAKVLVRYTRDELIRLKKDFSWENAAVLQPIGEGAVSMAMFHPYYGSDDIDVEAYEQVFAGSGTDWRAVHEKLSPEEIRMDFVYENMIKPLEDHEREIARPDRGADGEFQIETSRSAAFFPAVL